MRSQAKSFLTAGFTLLLAACSSSNSSTTGSTNEFTSLPEVTGPVTTTAGLGFRSLAAATGVSLASPGAFGAGTSLQMCENVNYLKEILREAASPDKILCYMGAMRTAGVIPSSANLSDGTAKYLKLVNLPDSGGGNEEPVVKVQLVKAASGAVTSFVMQACFSGTAGSPQQSEYVSQVFSGTTATVTSKYVGSETVGATTFSYGSSMTATGTFSTSWESKNISGYRYFSSSAGGSNGMTLNLNQYADRVDTSIAMKGRYGSDSFTNKFFSVFQILNSSKLATLAVGDGSSKYSMDYDQGNDGSSQFSSSGTISWAGDTKLNLGTASNGDYYARANAGTVPADPNPALTVTFSGAEVWDCAVPAGETVIEANFNNGGATITAGMQACEDKFLGNSSWIQCSY